MNRRYAVIGNPVQHSRSPWLHTYFARQTQRPIVYAAYQPAGSFADCASAFFAGGGCGLNITLPYKTDALAFADSASAYARQVAAANVLKRQADGSIRAYNTDGSGFLRDLQRLGATLSDKTILLLGAGGAAQAVAHAINRQQPARLSIYNRTPERAQQLAQQCGGNAIAIADIADERPAEIIINATSASHKQPLSYAPALFHQTQLAYDLSYGTAAQHFLRQAASAGVVQCVDGSGMLAWQAALSFALWEGVLPSVAEAIPHLQSH